MVMKENILKRYTLKYLGEREHECNLLSDGFEKIICMYTHREKIIKKIIKVIKC